MRGESVGVLVIDAGTAAPAAADQDSVIVLADAPGAACRQMHAMARVSRASTGPEP